MSSPESLKKRAKDLMEDMKDSGLSVGAGNGQWRTGFRPDPVTIVFGDVGEVDDFTGVFFAQTENGKLISYFNPPDELGLEHDDRHGKHEGYWKKFVPKEIKAVRTLVEPGISAPKSSSELRTWDSRKISKYLLGEAENYEALYACIIAQLENVPTAEAQTAIEQLTALMETTTTEEPGHKTKMLQVEEDPDKLARGMEGLTVSKKKTPSPPKPKATSPKATAGGSEKMKKLISMYNKKVEELANQDASTKDIEVKTKPIAVAIKRLADELGYDDDFMMENYEYLGFGRTRLKPYRRKSRRSNKKPKTMTMTRRTSGVKRKVRTSGRSLKKNKRRTSRRKTSKKIKKSFGSSIYGLQGGMQNGPVYSGVYPMTLKVNESLPNLNNVKRTYALNEFGSRKKNRGSKLGLRKKQSRKKSNGGLDRRGRKSKKAIVIDDDEGNSFGCGLYGCGSCGRSFGSCGCGGGGGVKEDTEDTEDTED